MPITVRAVTRRLEEAEFASIVYDVMGHVFEIRKEFGRFFDEKIYHREIARRCNGAINVPIEVAHAGFRKLYFIDLLVAEGVILEVKVADSLNDRHRSQLLQYLLLADLPRGKLINLRPESISHEFVNTTLRPADRTSFRIDDAEWDSDIDGPMGVRERCIGLLRDLGTGLDVALYEEVLTCLLGGEDIVVQNVDVSSSGLLIGSHAILSAGFSANFRITTIREADLSRVESHLRRFLEHTQLEATQWINVRHNVVTFKTLRR